MFQSHYSFSHIRFARLVLFFAVIALAVGHSERDLCFAGMVGIVDPPRPGVAESIEIVQSAGVHVKMVTGDSLETACNIGSLQLLSYWFLITTLDDKRPLTSSRNPLSISTDNTSVPLLQSYAYPHWKEEFCLTM